MNPPIRPATAGPVFTRVHARHADSRPDSFRAGARQIAALGADPEKIFRVWTDEGGPGRSYGLGRRRNEGGPGGPLCARRLLFSMTSASRLAPGAGAWAPRFMRR